MLIVMVLMGTVMLMIMHRSMCHLGCWRGEVHCNEIAPGVPAGDQVPANKDDGHKDGENLADFNDCKEPYSQIYYESARGVPAGDQVACQQ